MWNKIAEEEGTQGGDKIIIIIIIKKGNGIGKGRCEGK